MVKLIVFDIDGTLRDERYGIPDSAKKAIDICREKGYHLAICTGRNNASIQEDVKALHLPHLISGGGSFIRSQDHIIKNKAFLSSDIKAILAYLSTTTTGVSMESSEEMYMNQRACDILNQMNQTKSIGLSQKELQAFYQQLNIQYQVNLQTYQQADIHKVCLWTTPKQYQTIELLLRGELDLAQSVVGEHGPYYEIISKGCRKSDAIRELTSYLKLQEEEVLAFGDGMNDADMLETCGIGVAMQTSDQRLFPYANSICEAPMEDGIYKELERRKLI